MGLNKCVDFPTAKLLKEKGFDENTRYGYVGKYEPHHLKLTEFGYLQRNSELIDLVYSAPAISDVVDWIYEKHGIWIMVKHLSTTNWMYDIQNGIFSTHAEDKFNSPQEAYLAGIEYTLNNLI